MNVIQNTITSEAELTIVIDAAQEAAACEVAQCVETLSEANIMIVSDTQPGEEAAWQDVPETSDAALVVTPPNDPAGLAQVRRWSEERPETPVLAIAPYASPVQAGLTLGLGAKSVLARDSSLTALAEAVDKTIHGEAFADQGLKSELVDQYLRRWTHAPEDGTQITPAEWNTLSVLALGFGPNEGAEIMGVQPRTFRLGVGRIRKKLGLPNHAQVVQWAKACLNAPDAAADSMLGVAA